MQDPIRKGVATTIHQFKKAGITVRMLTAGSLHFIY